MFLGTEKIDRVLTDSILELGIKVKVKKTMHQGLYIYDKTKIEAKLETHFGKIMLFVRPLDEDYIDDVYVPFKEFATQRCDINPSKAYFHGTMDIYSPRRLHDMKEEWVIDNN